MKLVVVESPYAGDTPEQVERHVEYAREAMTDSLLRDEAPFLSHLLYPQVLDDSNPKQREAGIAAGLAWGDRAELRVVYCDLGVSPGMRRGIDRARQLGQPVEYRSIRGNDYAATSRSNLSAVFASLDETAESSG
jgi:hypothetical protein